MYIQTMFIDLLVLVFIVTIAEYILLRMMSLHYYRNGPFKTSVTCMTIHEKNEFIHNILETGIDRKKFFVKSLTRTILLSYRPSFKLWFTKGEFPVQRILITFHEGDPGTKICCDVRPFYSSFILPVFIALALIFDVVLPNQYITFQMKIFGVIFSCLIGLALFLPFRPRTDTVKKVMDDLKFPDGCRDTHIAGSH